MVYGATPWVGRTRGVGHLGGEVQVIVHCARDGVGAGPGLLGHGRCAELGERITHRGAVRAEVVAGSLAFGVGGGQDGPEHVTAGGVVGLVGLQRGPVERGSLLQLLSVPARFVQGRDPGDAAGGEPGQGDPDEIRSC